MATTKRQRRRFTKQTQVMVCIAPHVWQTGLIVAHQGVAPETGEPAYIVHFAGGKAGGLFLESHLMLPPVAKPKAPAQPTAKTKANNRKATSKTTPKSKAA